MTNPVFFAGIMLAAMPAFAADVNCGDTITEKVVITGGDITVVPCGMNPAITVDGGALDLNGFDIRCGSGGVGIEMIGVGSSVLNGSVDREIDSSCNTGIRVSGAKAKLESILVRSTSTSGIAILGAGAKLTHVTVRDSPLGFGVVGDGAQLSECYAIQNSSDGFGVSGNANQFKSCVATSNSDSGFSILSGTGNQLKECISVGNTFGIANTGEDTKLTKNVSTGNLVGYVHGNGNGAKYTKNTAVLNSLAGFTVLGGFVNSIKNTAVGDSGSSDGFNLSSPDGGKLTGNVAVGNGGAGVVLNSPAANYEVVRALAMANLAGLTEIGAAATTVTNNAALANDFAVLADNSGCVGITWDKNFFLTRLGACEE